MKAEASLGYLIVLGIRGSFFILMGFITMSVAFCSYCGLGVSSCENKKVFFLCSEILNFDMA